MEQQAYIHDICQLLCHIGHQCLNTSAIYTYLLKLLKLLNNQYAIPDHGKVMSRPVPRYKETWLSTI